CPCAAQLNRIKPPCKSAPIKGTPLDPRTLIPCSEETHSDLQVVSSIESTFEFRDGLISVQRDTCDPLDWSRQTFSGLKGELVGRVGWQLPVDAGLSGVTWVLA
ncbi:MAG: hypothetical protein ACKO2P_00595, partial [Planctomycetota bacterium]